MEKRNKQAINKVPLVVINIVVATKNLKHVTGKDSLLPGPAKGNIPMPGAGSHT